MDLWLPSTILSVTAALSVFCATDSAAAAKCCGFHFLVFSCPLRKIDGAAVQYREHSSSVVSYFACIGFGFPAQYRHKGMFRYPETA